MKKRTLDNMNVAILGDTHFGARNDHQAFHQYFARFYDEVFFPYLLENNIKTIIQMGDMFDRRRFVNFNTLNEARTYFFDKLVEHDLTMHMIVGNHCTYYKNTNEINSPNLLLGEYDNIHVYDNPTDISIANVSISMLPWICPDNHQRTIDLINTTKSKIAIGHLELTGFAMYKGSVNEHGLDPSMFRKYTTVLSGHFHHKSTKDNITYVGAPYEMTWSDYDDPRGFHILNLSDHKLNFIENPLKMFQKWWYNDQQWQTIEDLEKFDYSVANGAIVKVVIKSKNNPFWFDVFISNLEKAGALDIQIVDDNLNLQLEDDSDIIDQAEDTITILKNYAKQVNSDSVDSIVLSSFLSDLYYEAESIE